MADFRGSTRNGLAALFLGDANAEEIIAEHAVFDVAWPVNRLEGRAAIMSEFVEPMRSALTAVQRRDLLFIGGQNIREPGGTWCACVTHYVGNFDQPLFGLLPSKSMTFLRSGEFYRVEDGKITEAKIILDLPSTMLLARRMPIDMLGAEISFPAPATQDGLCPTTGNGKASLDCVEGMLGALSSGYDPETFSSPSQTGTDGYWADDMLWYGPAGVGSNYLWDGFVKDHREDFLRAFPDRVGGNHYCRIGDGNYAAVSGWPSMTMTFQGDYLGQKADGRALTLRVMDFYRCDFALGPKGKIKENWVTLDYGDLFHQMGRDLIAESNAMA